MRSGLLPMRVLVADDDLNVRTLVRRLLVRSFGVDVNEAPNGIEAMSLLLAERYDLLVTDLAMPLMGGLESISAVRASTSLAQLPIVVMTGAPEADTFARAMKMGISGFLVKPFEPKDFVERMTPIISPLLPVTSPAASVEPATSLLTLGPGKRVLVVDREPSVATTVQTILSRICPTTLAPQEFAAIKAAMEAPPDAVVVGLTSGLLPIETVVEKIRLATTQRPTCVIGAVTEEQIENEALQKLFDHLVIRDVRPSHFERSLRNILESSTKARLMLNPRSEWLAESLSEEAACLARQLGVSAQVLTVAPLLDMAPRWIAGVVALTGEGVRWICRVSCPVGIALEAASARTRSTDDVSEHAALETVGDLTRQIGARCVERGCDESLIWKATHAPAAFVDEPDPMPVAGLTRVWLVGDRGVVGILEAGLSDRRSGRD